MFSLSRRQMHAALAGVAAAATYYAAAEIGSKRPVRVGGLFMLSSLAMAGMVGQVLNGRASAKAHTAHQRIDALVPVIATVQTNVSNKYDKSGGTISGSVTVTGNHTVQGNHTIQDTLFGSGGAINLGDNIQSNGGATQVNDQLTVLSSSGVHTNGGFFGSNTTGDPHAGTAPSSWNTPYIQSLANRINDLLTSLG